MSDEAGTTCDGLPCCEGQLQDAQSRRIGTDDSGVLGESRDWSDRFVSEMRADVARSRIRHGRVPNDPSMRGLSVRSEILNRLGLAIDTGNRDYFVDVANFALRAWVEAGDE